jgi:ABC-type Fe3+/spermidine/putrescine transport system ATPase subunit
VADFIGTMNFFDGTLLSVEGGTATLDAGPVGRLRAPVDGFRPAADGRVTLAVRPEKLLIADAPPSNSANAVRGTMDAEAYLGDRRHFYVEVAGLSARLAVAAQTITRASGNGLARGREVWVNWPVEAGVLLPAE